MKTHTTTAPRQARFNGYTDRQVCDILQEIGTTADTLAVFAHQQSAESLGAETLRHIVAVFAERIGVLADLANESAIRSGAGEWMVGAQLCADPQIGGSAS